MKTVFKDLVTNLDWALYYHRELDWVVFPVYEMQDGICSCPKGVDCPKKQRGKHPRIMNDWQDIRSNTEEQIVAWWTKWPDANIAIHTGASRLCVVDCDKGYDATKAIPAYVLEHGTVKAISGSGYIHTYCEALPDGYHLAKNGPGVGPQVDIQLGDHYILAAPSNHKSGEVYHWKEDFQPSKSNLPAAIPLDLLKKWNQNKIVAAPEDAGKVIWEADVNEYGEWIPQIVLGNFITEKWVSEAVKEDNPDWKSSFNVVKGLELMIKRFRELCTHVGKEGDRSDHLVHCIYELCKQGFNDNQITHVFKIMSIGTHPDNKIDEMSASYLPGLIRNKREALAVKDAKDAKRTITWNVLSDAEREKIFKDVAAGRDTSDYSIAKYFKRDMEGEHGFVSSRGWMDNMGNGYWKIDVDDANISRKVSNFIHRIRVKILAAPEDAKLARINANTGKVASILEALSKELAMDEELFNSYENHWYLSCPNGLVDLKTGKFSDRTDLYLAHQINVEYHPGDSSEREEHVMLACQHDKDMYRTLRLHHGLWIIGETAFRKSTVIMGETGSGKTTLMAPIHEMLGSLCAHAERGTFISGERVDKFQEAKFPGVRLIDASEVGNMRGLKQAYHNKLTGGGDTMPYRAIWGKPGEYVNEGTPCFITDKPDIPLDTFEDATMSRFQFFRLYKTWEDADLGKARYYRTDVGYLRQTLNFCVEAAMDLWQTLEAGGDIPEHKDSIRYKKRAKIIRDPVGVWYQDCVTKDKMSGKISSRMFIESFWQWEQERELGLDRGTYNPSKAISRLLKTKNHGKRIAWRNAETGGTDYRGFTIRIFELTEGEFVE